MSVYINGKKVNSGVFRNGFNIELAKVSTTNATVTELWQSPALADNKAIYLKARVVAMETDGSDRGIYNIEGIFYRDGGNVSQQGSTISVNTLESDADWDVDFSLDTVNQEVNVVVTGEAATNITWKGKIEYLPI